MRVGKGIIGAHLLDGVDVVAVWEIFLYDHEVVKWSVSTAPSGESNTQATVPNK